MKKQNIIWSIVLILIIIFVSSATIYAKKTTDKDENELLKIKVKEEINYLDSKISSMLNSLNNISLKNYIVKAEKINSQNNQTEDKASSSGETSGGTTQQAASTSEENNSSASEEEQKQPKTTTKMEYNNIIGNERKVDWNELKTSVESLYSSWSVIILDLYKLNINGEKILKFSNLLDTLTIDIKEENKEKTLNTLTNMYSSIVGYVNEFSDEEQYKNILITRENIFYAYAKVDTKNWEEIQTRLQQAEIAYSGIWNDINSNNEKEFNLNKGYILLKELQNSVKEKDEDVFYIKYKNLMEEINLLMA